MKQNAVEDIAGLSQLANELLDYARGNKVFAFYGEMGVGKTTFIKAICKAVGVKDNVNSPTFALVNEYRAESGSPVYHFDFYRIENENEALDIGCEEYFYSGNYCFIEWPEKISNLLPEDHVKVHIEVVNDKRIITFQK